jgi:hypothetical protein
MAVVINEFEVAPPAAAPPSPAASQGQGKGQTDPETLRQIQGKLHLEQERKHRLAVY